MSAFVQEVVYSCLFIEILQAWLSFLCRFSRFCLLFYSLSLCVCVRFYVFQSHTHTLSLLTSATFSVSLILKWLWLRFGWVGVVSDSSLRFFRLYHFQSCIVCLMKSKSDVFIGGLRRELLFASQLTACLSKTHPCHLLQPVENHSLAILQVTLTS